MKNIATPKVLLIFSFLFLSGKIIAQRTCNCLENLDTLIKKTELNYVGYPDKVTKKSQSQYKQLIKKLRANAIKRSDPQKCFSILKEYVGFFYDKHFDLEYSVTDTAAFEYSSLTESGFVKTFANKKREAIEGLWISPDSSVKMAVYKVDATTYKAVIVQSSDNKLRTGLVYYTLTKDKDGYTFNRYDWLTPDFPVRQHGGLLHIWNFEIWGKVYPDAMTSDERSELLTWRHYNFGLNCKKLDDNNVLLTIGSFNHDDKVKEIIQKNDSLIRSTKNLIVDLRGNGGGNTGWVYLLPYFYTQPIQQGDTYLRLSPENIQANLPGIKWMAENPSTDPAWKKSYTPEYLAAYRKAYEEIPHSKNTFYTLPTMTLYADSILKTPQKIALIFDDLGGSSTEFFFYISKQSSKIVRYGEHTLGMMDYMGISQQTKLPFDDYYLLIPDRKSPWTDAAPTNKTGFIPESDLSHLPHHQWIEYIKADLEKE